VPDIELPDTEPLYVAPAPTAPNVIRPPCTRPVQLYVPFGFESLIDPVSFEPDCFHLRVNVPENAPLYDPDHFPASELLCLRLW
jgi:hypothetical protein